MLPNVMDILKTYHPFQEWLKKQPGEEQIKYNGMYIEEWPILSFLKAKGYKAYFDTYGDLIVSGLIITLPLWLAVFNFAIRTDHPFITITMKQARELLAKLIKSDGAMEPSNGTNAPTSSLS